MKVSKSWCKRRWLEFRMGHSTYLIFIPTAINAILLAFNLIVVAYLQLENNPLYLGVFAVVALACYFPLGVLAGRYHNKKQLPTDNAILSLANPVLVEILETTRSMNKRLENLEGKQSHV